MSNVNLTIDDITHESLRVLHQKSNFIGNIVRDYDDSFAVDGAKIGDTIRVRLPIQYATGTGSTMATGTGADSIGTSTTLQISTQRHVPMRFSSAEMATDIDDFSKRHIEPAMTKLSAMVENNCIATALTGTANLHKAATLATPVHKDMMEVRKILQDSLSPKDARTFLMDTQLAVDLNDALKGYHHDDKDTIMVKNTNIVKLLFNKILGDIYKKDFYILNSLLTGNYEWFYFTRALYVINYLYSFFSTENAYLIIDAFCKIIAYVSFFKLSKLVNNKIFYSFLIAAIYSYASTTTFTDYHSSIFGFGSVILPYMTYLTLKNKDLKIRNYLIIILGAINSHFYFGIFYLLIPFILYFYNNNLNKIKSLKIFITFFIFCILANSNLLYLAFFFDVTFNRDNWQAEGISIYSNVIYFFSSLFYFPLHFVEIKFSDGEIGKILYFTTFFNKICLFLIYTLNFFLLVTNKIKNSRLFIFIILGILFFSFIVT